MKYLMLACAFALLLSAAPGCWLTDDSPTAPPFVPPASDGGIDLDSPTGGLTADDEAPAFGEPEAFAAFPKEAPVQDPIERTIEFQRQYNARGARIFDFRAIWGNLPRIDAASAADECPLDWSGRLHLEGGIIAVTRIIAFEPGDSLYRIDRSTIGWISHTGTHVDGIHVKLVVPPPPPTDSARVAVAEPKLVLRTGPYSRTFTLDELVALQILVPVDMCGNGISIGSVLMPPFCPHGQLMGGWKLLPPQDVEPSNTDAARDTVLGVFRGVWIGHHGQIMGYLRGAFGLNSEGKRVFFGKYIDESGRFMGILRGEYGRRPDVDIAAAHPHGWFAGEWIGERRELKGRLKGHWIMDSNGGAGCFHGVWGTKCSRNL